MRDNPESDDLVTPPGRQTRVAVIIPILNESATLGLTLASLANQDYSSDLVEVLIIDGGSDDEWQSIVDAFAPNLHIRTLDNPARITPVSVNLGLKQTDADTVLWISGHCRLDSDYITKLVAAHEAHPGTVVGGRLLVEGRGFAGNINAQVLKSPIGTGMAPWRYKQESPWVESANFALFDRQLLLNLGGLDERLVRNQDNDLVRRLKTEGIKFYQADTCIRYLAPATFQGLWRRAWGNSTWTIWCWRMGIPSARWYHLAPMAVVLLGLILAAISFQSRHAFIMLAALSGLYFVLALTHTVLVSFPKGPFWALPFIPLQLFLFHLVYGLGGWAALLLPPPRRSDGQTP